MQKYEIYDNAIRVFYKNLDKIAKKYADAKRRIVVFGSNSVSGMVVEYLENKKCFVEMLIDNDASREGMIIYEKKVFKPCKLKESYDEAYLVLIVSSFQKEMIEQLENYGYRYGEQILKVIDLPELMSDYSHADTVGLVKMEVLDIRKCQINLILKLQDICEEYNLRYYIAFGTLLGAIRHRGYIPWDDDVDIHMPIDDFLKLINILENNERYAIVSHFNTDYYLGSGLSLFVDLSTVSYSNKFPLQISTGQSIDIFPLYGLPEDECMRTAHIKEVKKLEEKCVITNYSREKNKEAISRLNETLLRYSYDSCNWVGNVMAPYFTKSVYKKCVFGEGVNVEFEGEMVRAPIQWDMYLRPVYGNYMKLPPEEKRNRCHFYQSYFKV